MRRLKRLACLVLALGCLMAWSLPVLATEENSLTIQYENDGEKMVNAPFSIYLVAWKNENGQLVVAEDFTKYHINISDDQTTWPALASTLVAYAAMGRISPVRQGCTDQTGTLRFSNLSDGIYLVEGALHQQSEKYFTAEPALIQLPGTSSAGVIRRDVTISPKAEWVPDGGGKNIKVLKVWEDQDSPNRPEAVTVHLLSDGELMDTVELTAENRWQHTWNGLEVGHAYTVAEENVEGYTVTIQRYGITFVVTNTKRTVTPPDDPGPPDVPDKPVKPDVPDIPVKPVIPEEVIPETGQPWTYVLLLTAAGLLLLVVGLYIRRGMSHET